MRKELAQIHRLRREFTATFVRFGSKTNFKGYPETTILLSNIQNPINNKIFAEHLWFNLTKEFDKIELKEGDVISFHARVKEYYKGYKGYREELQWEKPVEKDYKLSHPTKIKLLKRIEAKIPLI